MEQRREGGMTRLAACVLTGVAAAVILAPAASARERFVAVGTGGAGGMYELAGETICRIVNRGAKTHGFRCEASATPGSVFNLNQLRAGEFDIAIAQSDWQYHAYNGTSVFKDKGPHKGLRSLFSLHVEPFTVVARRDAGIGGFADLKGKRVNLLNPGSGSRATTEVVLSALGWKVKDFALAGDLKAAEQGAAFCARRFDAFVYTVAHPNPLVNRALDTCDGSLVPVQGAAFDKLVKDAPYFVATWIDADDYDAISDPVPTFGVVATVVATRDFDKERAYQLVKAVLGNLDDFSKAHPAFRKFRIGRMRRGNTAPIHDGALRAFDELKGR